MKFDKDDVTGPAIIGTYALIAILTYLMLVLV